METQSYTKQPPDQHFVEAAQMAVRHPEVIEAMKTLSKHGLGVCLPHMHGEKGDFLPLSSDQVQLESDLTVSFERKDSPKLRNTIPVAWRWDEEVHILACCQWLAGRVCSSNE